MGIASVSTENPGSPHLGCSRAQEADGISIWSDGSPLYLHNNNSICVVIRLAFPQSRVLEERFLFEALAEPILLVLEDTSRVVPAAQRSGSGSESLPKPSA